MYGVDADSKAYSYIRGYAGKSGAYRAAVRVLGIVEKILAEILSAAEAVETEAVAVGA
jgi:hypothetical protein